MLSKIIYCLVSFSFFILPVYAVNEMTNKPKLVIKNVDCSAVGEEIKIHVYPIPNFECHEITGFKGGKAVEGKPNWVLVKKGEEVTAYLDPKSKKWCTYAIEVEGMFAGGGFIFHSNEYATCKQIKDYPLCPCRK